MGIVVQPIGDVDHQIYVWDAHELMEAVGRAREGVHKVVEANEKMKSIVDADAIAIGQLLQSGAKIAKQIKLLGVMGRAYLKEAHGKTYIIFKGDAKLRPNLSGTRYLAENAKVRCFVVGSKDILADAAKGTKVAIVAFVVWDIVAEVTSDHPSFTSLGVQIGSDVLQAAVATYAGALAGVVLVGLGAPAVLTFVVVVAAGFAVGMVLSEVDRRYKLTERAKARMLSFEKELQKDYVIAKQNVAIAGQRVSELGRQAVKDATAEWYRFDKYYSSVAQMVADDSPYAGGGIFLSP